MSKDTLQLPKTAFSMKASLPTKEPEILKKYEKQYNFKNVIVQPFMTKRKIISSTFIRKKITKGQIEEVNELLNRNWSIKGKVIKGQKRGRKIGFPTCNLRLNSYVIPRLGVYAVKVKTNSNYFII